MILKSKTYLDKWVTWVEHEGLLLLGVVLGGGVVASLVGLGLHDALHVSGPAVVESLEGGGRVLQLLGDDGLLDLLAEGSLLQPGEKGLELLLHLLLEVL